jgi:hypothetical protein
MTIATNILIVGSERIQIDKLSMLSGKIHSDFLGRGAKNSFFHQLGVKFILAFKQLDLTEGDNAKTDLTPS